MGELLDAFRADPVANDPRPTIAHNRRQLDDVVTDAINALTASNTRPDGPHLFVRGGQLVRVRPDERGRPIIEALDPVRCRDELGAAARWYTTFKDAPARPGYPPAEVAAVVVARGQWPLPPLAGIVEHPVLRPDGTFAVDHGYDAATGLYHWHHGEPYAPIPQTPTRAELAAAVALVEEALCDFCWDTSADRANAWGLLITQLVRPIVGQTPMALIDAPSPGTGKTLLVRTYGHIIQGHSGAMMPWPRNDEELEKKISSLLIAGATLIVWDNVEGIIRSEVLASALTTDVWRGRILGQSQMVALPNDAVWVATGNNLSVGGDLARRCYRIRLDAHHAQPWQREGFTHPDLDGWVKAHRNQLLAALCTIVRSWWTAGRPMADGIAAMGGFTTWARTVGGILNHAGVGGFLANLAAFVAEADVDAQQWEAFLGAWTDGWGEQAVTTGELIAAIEGGSSAGQALKETLPDDLAGAWGTAGFSRRFGLALRKRVGRHYGADGAHLIEHPRDRRRVAVYAVTTRPAGVSDAQLPHSNTTPAPLPEQPFDTGVRELRSTPANPATNPQVDESGCGSAGDIPTPNDLFARNSYRGGITPASPALPQSADDPPTDPDNPF